jgi:hypothetical protein
MCDSVLEALEHQVCKSINKIADENVADKYPLDVQCYCQGRRLFDLIRIRS